jgi:hypothetical protein
VNRLVVLALAACGVLLVATGGLSGVHSWRFYSVSPCDLTKVAFVTNNGGATGGILTPRVSLILPPHGRCTLNANLVLTVRGERGKPLPMPGNPSAVHLLSAIAPGFIGAMWDFHYCGKTQTISYEFRVGQRASVMAGGVLMRDSDMCQAVRGNGGLSLLAACPKPLGHHPGLIWRCRQ